MAGIVERAESYVCDLLTNKLHPDFLYHNLRHTERVVKNTKVLIENIPSLKEQEKEDLLVAAWFHDTGFVNGAEDHEKQSALIAGDFLSNEGWGQERIDKIRTLILATRLDARPESLSEEILRDADCSHLAKESYLETTELLREELERTGQADYSVREWRNENIKLLSNEHRFHTAWARDHWQSGKDENLATLLSREKKESKQVRKAKLKAKYKLKNSDRGVQTMYRVALNNHLRLSSIADTKANILLSVNAIIISVALSNLIPKLDNPSNKFLVIPTMVLLFFSVISIIFAIMSTRPNVTKGEFTLEEIREKKANLLFFGTFHQMPYEQYEDAVKEMIDDSESIYEALTKDLYLLGKVLARKYKLLRMTYTVFLVGTVISVLAFVVAYAQITV